LRDPRPPSGGRLRLHALGEHAHRASEIPLRPLSPEDAARIVDLLYPEAEEPTRDQVVALSEGNPLYLEELARLAKEGRELPHRAPFTVTAPVGSLLPPALDSVLIARIDALDPEPREVAQAAAVIGRQFSGRLLGRVLGSDDLEGALASLMRADVIREAGGGGDREFVFRHGLLQEAALSTLTSTRRRELYIAAAAAVEDLLGDAQDAHLEILAHYHAQSGEPERAALFLEKAAARAQELGASDRASALLERAHRAARQAH
jgi:predicted ATPase